MIKEILEYNKQFVAEKKYEQYKTSKYPDKKIAILSCMDTRLTELLPAALGIKMVMLRLLKMLVVLYPMLLVVLSEVY